MVKLLRRLKVPDDAKVHALEGKFDERPVLVIMDDADKKILGGWFMDDGTSIPDDGASSWSTSSEVDGLLDRLSVQSDLASSEISHAGEIADVESGESESENAGSTELSSDEETEDTEHEEDA